MMLLNEMLLTKARFTAMVEDTVKNKRVSYLDAILILCENNKLDVEDIKKFISDPIKDKLEAEAISLNFLPRGNQLPI